MAWSECSTRWGHGSALHKFPLLEDHLVEWVDRASHKHIQSRPCFRDVRHGIKFAEPSEPALQVYQKCNKKQQSLFDLAYSP